MSNEELETRISMLEKRILTLELDLAEIKANRKPARSTNGLTMGELNRRIELLECSLDEDGIRRKLSFSEW